MKTGTSSLMDGKDYQQRKVMKDYSFQITKKQYDYLLPVLGNCGSKQLLSRVDRKVEKYYYIGSYNDYKEVLNICKYLN
jgi:hypothetical protein